MSIDEPLQQAKELIDKKLAQAELEMARLKHAQAALAALLDQKQERQPLEPSEEPTSTKGVEPPIMDIYSLLKQRDKPVHQNEIIHKIGAERIARYPSLTNHYQSIWRALEYHVRHGRMIACVDPTSWHSVLLKPLPKRPKGSKLHNDPALYEQDNWFVLLEKIVERPASPVIQIAPNNP